MLAFPSIIVEAGVWLTDVTILLHDTPARGPESDRREDRAFDEHDGIGARFQSSEAAYEERIAARLEAIYG